MIFRPDQQPETKQNREILPGLNFFKDWQLSVKNVLNYLSLNRN